MRIAGIAKNKKIEDSRTGRLPDSFRLSAEGAPFVLHGSRAAEAEQVLTPLQTLN
jgi:hypothetical protein